MPPTQPNQQSGEYPIIFDLLQTMIQSLQDEVRGGFKATSDRLAHIEARLSDGAQTMAQHDQRLHEISGSMKAIGERTSRQSDIIQQVRESICEDCDDRVHALETAHRERLVREAEHQKAMEPRSALRATIINTIVVTITNAVLATIAYYMFVLPTKLSSNQSPPPPPIVAPPAGP